MSDKETYNNKVLNNYEELETEMMVLVLNYCYECNDIAMLNRTDFNKLKMKVSNKVYKEAKKKVSSTNTKRKKEVNRLFNSQASEIEKEYSDYTVSKEQKRIIKKNIKLTNDSLEHLGRELAKGAKKTVIDTMGELYKQVIKADNTFDIGFKRTTDKFFEKGITFTDRIGRNRSVEATVRQNLLYRINQTNRDIYKEVGKKLNTTGWQINISPNCRDTHQVINGQTFTNEEWEKYKYLTDEYNCQHIAEPIFIELEENKYSQEEIDNANNKTINYKGEEMSYYDATQRQRALERAIRNAKKNVVVANKTGFQIDRAKNLLSKAQARMREYINETGLTRDYDREYFAGYN